jgi:pimeloyl-ACP methyl ester carboxylesterase
MNPASLRSAGVVFDNEGTLPGERVAAITLPTLIFHAVDDTLQLYHNAEFAVSTIPDAKLVSFERGGHVVVIVEQSTIRAATQEHILTHIQDLPGEAERNFIDYLKSSAFTVKEHKL